ncbi:hypothetical protein [Hydrogenophaga laconesensis]|uniref:Uncharacterized protein n=1 Tax=Hydrogenophaga laconesensis TaxID=1805971 RepID=A0ABU1V9N0_9BURK|nr:hypothetical protein [Hydrogenophaga laconesensis]MDR7094142.1 hypothetical protein [Hydrogenophaga laconesensis]
MAGRPMGKLHQEDVRRKIQASQLLNVLQDHALNDGSEISMSRLKAIEILLKKSLPDLSAIQIDQGNGDDASVADVVRAFHERRASGS